MKTATVPTLRASLLRRYLSDFALAAGNLLSQKTRTLLTALGIIFGVGAVIGMLAIGAGARDESLRFIEQLGVRNLLIDSIASTSDAELQQRRRSSQGLNDRDVRIVTANLEAMNLLSARRTLHPSRMMPKAVKETPWLYGVEPSYAAIHNWNLDEGAVFTEADNAASAAVCVLGETAKTGLLGFEPAVGKYIKVEDTWLRVVGVLKELVASGSQNVASAASDVNNRVYIPLNTFQYRFWDMSGYLRDPLDGVDIQLKTGADSVQAAKVVVAILNSTHRGTQDFSVTIPAELLAQQQREQVIFTYVMVAIAAISLLVGGIGIMNIVLATVLERTREIGIRRATGARRGDIVRQFLLESVLISTAGGVLGIGFGYFLSWFIARAAEWKTIVTTSSILIAFGVSVGVGVVFGIYPAMKASRIDPIEALRYE